MAGQADFILLIDGTGSMQPCIDSLKENLNVFLDELVNEQGPLRDWRGKVITYRDHQYDGAHWFEEEPFVHNDGVALKAQLEELSAYGGGDEPESLLDSLHKISSMGQTEEGLEELDPYKWRRGCDAGRVVIVFTDATYHEEMTYPEGKGGSRDDVENSLVSNKIKLCLFAPDHDLYEELNAIDKAEWEAIPALGDGNDKFAKGLEQITGKPEKFKDVLIALAKSVSSSASTPEL
jgi:hypothetical protein